MDGTTKTNQCKRVADFIDQHGSINPIEALSCLSVMRLAARIKDLEKAGARYEHEMVTGTNVFGETVRFMRYKKAV